MAEQNQDMQAVIAQALQGAMAQMKQMQAPAAVPMPSAAPMAPAAQSFGVPALTGWSVPVEQEISGMTVTLYLNFPAETFAQAPNIIMTLVNQGFQVRAFQKNNGGWGGNNNGWGTAAVVMAAGITAADTGRGGKYVQTGNKSSF